MKLPVTFVAVFALSLAFASFASPAHAAGAGSAAGAAPFPQTAPQLCAVGKQVLTSVNGKTEGVTFIPGHSYHIIGQCFGPGDSRFEHFVGFYEGSPGTAAFVQFRIDSWSDAAIDVTVPSDAVAKPFRTNLTLYVGGPAALTKSGPLGFYTVTQSRATFDPTGKSIETMAVDRGECWAGQMRIDTINGVNVKNPTLVLSPGPLTITGCGFGSPRGQVFFYSEAIKISLGDVTVSQWSDKAISGAITCSGSAVSMPVDFVVHDNPYIRSAQLRGLNFSHRACGEVQAPAFQSAPNAAEPQSNGGLQPLHGPREPRIIKVSATDGPERFLSYPVETILEAPDGKRITVGELKKLSVEKKQIHNVHSIAQKPALPPVTIKKSAGAITRRRAEDALAATRAFAYSGVVPLPPGQNQRTQRSTQSTATSTGASFPQTVHAPDHQGATDASVAAGLPHDPSSQNPQNPGAGLAVAPCAMRQPAIYTVNSKTTGVLFTPGGSYFIKGCGFGDHPGTVVLQGGTGGGSFTLKVQAWFDNYIWLTLDSTITGVNDQNNSILTVTPAGGSPLQQGGETFVAIRSTVTLQHLPLALYSSMTGPYGPMYSMSSTGVDRGAVSRVASFTGYCDLSSKRADTLDLNQLPLSPNFGVDNVSVTNTTYQDTLDDDAYQIVLSAPLQVQNLSGNAVEVDYQLRSVYAKKHLFWGGDSDCAGSYEVVVTVSGPRGIPALTL